VSAESLLQLQTSRQRGNNFYGAIAKAMGARKTINSREIIRVASVFEAAKGLIVLFAGFGLLTFIHKNIRLVAEQFVRHLNLNPARHYPKIFLDVINHTTDWQLWALTLSSLIYAMVRFAEAYGLWFHRQWAEWFGFLTGGMYIPVEIYEILLGVTWIKLTILILNLAIVVFLGKSLYQSRQSTVSGRGL